MNITEINHASKITFIIPTIGRSTLRRTLQSLQDQTNQNFKCIVVFDGIDPTITVDDNRFKIIRTNKLGQASNSAGLVRNEGMKLVNTEWIGFVDDDDTLSNTYVDKFYAEIEQTPDASTIIFRMLESDGKTVLPRPNHKDFYVNEVGISFAMKKSLFTEGFSFIPSSTEDYALLDKIRSHKRKMVISPYCTYFVRQSNKDFDAAARERMNVCAVKNTRSQHSFLMATKGAQNVYYINLDRSIKRRKRFESIFSNDYKIHRIRAFDGKTDLSNYRNVKFPTIGNCQSSICEIACSLSHVYAIWTAFNHGRETAIVMEDDAMNQYSHIWGRTETLTDIASRAPKDAECIVFTCVNSSEIVKMLAMKEEFSEWNEMRWGTQCYLVRRSGMEKIVDCYITESGQIDLQKRRNITRFTCDNDILYPVLKTYNYNRPTIHHCVKTVSTIHTNHNESHRKGERVIAQWFNRLQPPPNATKVPKHNKIREMGQNLTQKGKPNVRNTMHPKTETPNNRPIPAIQNETISKARRSRPRIRRRRRR